jgi:hypothetical protein
LHPPIRADFRQKTRYHRRLLLLLINVFGCADLLSYQLGVNASEATAKARTDVAFELRGRRGSNQKDYNEGYRSAGVCRTAASLSPVGAERARRARRFRIFRRFESVVAAYFRPPHAFAYADGSRHGRAPWIRFADASLGWLRSLAGLRGLGRCGALKALYLI